MNVADSSWEIAIVILRTNLRHASRPPRPKRRRRMSRLQFWLIATLLSVIAMKLDSKEAVEIFVVTQVVIIYDMSHNSIPKLIKKAEE